MYWTLAQSFHVDWKSFRSCAYDSQSAPPRPLEFVSFDSIEGLLESPSVEEDSTTSTEPSLFTMTGIAWPDGVTACFLVLTVGVPLD